MIPNSKAFAGKTFFEHGGKTFYRWHKICILDNYKLVFRFIQTNSVHRQGIALFFSDFKGRISLNGCNLPILKGRFKHYVFKEDEFPDNQFILSIHAESGALIIGNASETTGYMGFECGALGCAFWTEQLSENKMRFHCNDHEYDDDFDDLIFDMEVAKE